MQASLLFRKAKLLGRIGTRSIRHSEKNTFVDYAEDLFSSYQRRKLMLSSLMTTRHRLSMRLPSFISRQQETVYSPSFNLSEVAGHGSFLFLLLGYLETDFLHLRLYAFSGISLAVLFQYYRATPLWLPISWNALFLCINAVMIAHLLKEQSDANNLSEEETYLYEKCFKHKGMSRIDFMHLISTAKRMETTKGTKLVEENKKNTRVYLVKDGTLSVFKGDERLGTIKEGQFVGAMSYLQWQTKRNEKAVVAAQEAEVERQKRQDEHETTHASEDEMAAGVASDILGKLFNGWVSEDTSTTSETSETTQPTAVPATAQLTIDTTVATIRPPVVNSPSTTSSTSPKHSLTIEIPTIAATSSAPTSPQHARSPSNSQQSSDDGHLGQADVVCDDDCVVYFWKFKDLYELMQHHPMLGLVFERSISEDLNKKMSSTWRDELRFRYKSMLGQAVQRFHLHHRGHGWWQATHVDTNADPNTNKDGLADYVEPRDRASLQKFRETNSITDTDHSKMLQDVLQEHAAVLKVEEEEERALREREDSVTKQYRTILTNELKRPRGVSDSVKRHLRDFRLTHGITGEKHLEVLLENHWTLEEYELGRQLTAKDRLQYENRRATPVSTPAGAAKTGTTSTGGNTSPVTSGNSSIDSFLAAKYGRSTWSEADMDSPPVPSQKPDAEKKGVSSLFKRKPKDMTTDEKVSKQIQQDLLAAVRKMTHGDDALLAGLDEIHLHYMMDDDVTKMPETATIVAKITHDEDGTHHKVHLPQELVVSPTVEEQEQEEFIEAVEFMDSVQYEPEDNSVALMTEDGASSSLWTWTAWMLGGWWWSPPSQQPTPAQSSPTVVVVLPASAHRQDGHSDANSASSSNSP